MDKSIRTRRKEFEKNKRIMGVHRHHHGKRSDGLTPREKWITSVATFQVFFLAWSLGSVQLWAQWANLGIASVAFLGLLIPDAKAIRGDGLRGIGVLLRSPVFWFGALFASYVGIQCGNYSWQYESLVEEPEIVEMDLGDGSEKSVETALKKVRNLPKEKAWHILPVDNTKYPNLPTSVEAPFDKMNAARVLLMFEPVWLWACILTIGLHKRRGLRRILWAAALGGASMALLGMVQRLTGAKGILWGIESSNPAFFGTFIYPNHGAAFLYLTLGVAIGLAMYHQQRAEQEFLRSGPHYLLAFLSALLLLGLVFSQSRAGIVLGCGVALVGGCIIAIRMLGKGQDMRQGIVLGIMAVLGLGFAGYSAMNFADIGSLLMDYERLQGAGSPDLSLRLKLQEATWEGFLKNKWFGTGAGSFQYRFPFLQQFYPELGIGIRFFVHAHNDYLQVLMEYGIIGTLALGGFFGSLLWGAVRSIRQRPAMMVCMLAGIGGFCLHAWWDFPSFCQSVLLLVVFVLSAMGSWGESERLKQRIDNI